jgi:hypothetical protein
MNLVCTNVVTVFCRMCFWFLFLADEGELTFDPEEIITDVECIDEVALIRPLCCLIPLIYERTNAHKPYQTIQVSHE